MTPTRPQARPQALVVDDERIARENLAHVLARQGLETATAEDGRAALAELEKREFDLVLTDLVMEGVDGFAVLRRAKELHPDTEVIVITGHPEVDTAVEAMRLGAYHYLAKPIELAEARVLVDKAMEKRRLSLEVRDLREQVAAQCGPSPLLGASPAMEELKRTIARVAAADSTVLILGETGTGKELVARTLHALGRRSGRRFLGINCGAFNEELLENELFGHEPGAFSGATRQKKGLFEAADGGTLFLDEVGEMAPAMQVKLLRALQERTVRRVGGAADIAVDVRIMAATNKDLKDEIAAGNFRQDLYYRLNVITIWAPPLSERRGDIPLLARRFLDKAAGALDKPRLALSPEALAILEDYPYPGNVRELENILERAAVMADGPAVLPAHLPPDLTDAGGILRVTPANGEPAAPLTLEENERRHISRVLAHCSGNKTQAAKALGIDRASLWRKLKRFGLE
ncbi:MAG: sigma-54 dependent transcriptional regulator [Thermodesulfobacteriota bacterium]